MELPGRDHLAWGEDADAIVDEIEEFLTGVRHGPEPDRVLATVLFTDIVGSTEKAAALGDRRWRDLLEGHHTLVRRELARFRGREIDTSRRWVPRDVRRTRARRPLRPGRQRRGSRRSGSTCAPASTRARSSS